MGNSVLSDNRTSGYTKPAIGTPIPTTFRNYYSSDASHSSSLRIAEQFFYDVRSITTEQRNEISTNFGTEGLVVLMICLALYDGAFRVMSVLGHWEKFSE